MALSLEAELGDKSVLCQQDTDITVWLRNAGKQGVGVLTSDMPVLRALYVATGDEREYCLPPQPPAARRPAFVDLEPNKSIAKTFGLLEFAPRLQPGVYNLTVTWQVNPTTTVSSEPMRLEVLPATPGGLSLADAMGGVGESKVAVWVNVARERFTIVQSWLSLKPGLTTVSKDLGIKCAGSCRPAVSTPPSDEALSGNWIAWLDEDSLYCVHSSPTTGLSRERRVALPLPEGQLVLPLHSDAPGKGVDHPNGGAVVCYPIQNDFTFQSFEFTPKKAVAGKSKRIPGGVPVWTHSFARSEGERLVAYVQRDGGTSRLHLVNWPGFERADVPEEPLKEWAGTILGAGARVNIEDGLNGAFVLLETSPEGEKSVRCVTWMITRANGFGVLSEHDVDWPANEAIAACKMGVSDDGRAVAFLKNAADVWSAYERNMGVVPLPIAPQHAHLPFEPAFLRGMTDVLLVAAEQWQGLRVVDVAGNPLPRFIDK